MGRMNAPRDRDLRRDGMKVWDGEEWGGRQRRFGELKAEERESVLCSIYCRMSGAALVGWDDLDFVV
jgi:hypothetical protein